MEPPDTHTKGNDDPLQLKDLAIDFDYLLFKIKDHITGLAELTSKSVVKKKQMIEDDYFSQQLQLDDQLRDADNKLKECADLQMLFSKLEQISGFVHDFKTRLDTLEREFSTT